MSFVSADAYDRFMGRYAAPLAPLFADLAGLAPGQRALDVGCGPGALTAVLVDRLGTSHVAAVDPSGPFVAAAQVRFPDVDVREGSAEELPFSDDEFDVALAQLVVNFMADPAQGVSEMARVTGPGGVVAACVWDGADSRAPITPLARATRHISRRFGEADFRGASPGDLADLFNGAGLAEVSETSLEITVRHETFEEWWEPYTLGVGRTGDFVRSLTDEEREIVRQACRDDLGPGPFDITARTWAATGRVTPR
jgi:SAM-dependent methyltransferase